MLRDGCDAGIITQDKGEGKARNVLPFQSPSGGLSGLTGGVGMTEIGGVGMGETGDWVGMITGLPARTSTALS